MIPDARVMEPQVAVTTPRLVRWLAEEIAFLVKAARPGFWLTSIWFYLVPVGGRQVLDQAEFWLGLVYVSFPLGLLIYGWNDVVDFDVDRFNPRKGTYLFGARGTPERLARLPWRMALVQVPFAILFTLLLGPKALAWFAALIVATAVYNCQPFAFKGRLPARLRARELAEPRVTGALVYVPFRCHVCDALPSVRRNHGLGTRSARRPPDTRRCPRSTTGQVAVGRAPAIRGSPPSWRQALPGSRWTSCSCGVIDRTRQRRCASCFLPGTPWHSRPCPGCGTRLRWRQGSHPLIRRGTCRR